MARREVVPLLSHSGGKMKTDGKKKTGMYNPAFDMDLEDIVREKEYWEDDFDEDRILFADDKKRGTMLIWNDFLILTVEYIQWLMLIQSLAIRWPWPENWMKAMSWLFAFNLDAWEISKVADNMTYKSVQDYSSDSSLMPFSYWHVLVAWAAFLAILAVAYLVAYIVLSKRDDPFLMVKISNMQRVYIIIIQLLALPLGVAFARVFHCVMDAKGETSVMYVDNTQSCFGEIQWAYAAAALGVTLPFYIGFAVWLVHYTKIELIFSHAAGHEAYLQLKETEYAQGLDMLYVVSGFHIFSSFKLRAVHFRAAKHILKFVVVICYAGLFYDSLVQALVLTCVVLVYFISLAILRPFRVRIFNVLLTVNMLCLVANALTGALRTSFDVYSLRSVWFTPAYTTSMLIAVNGGWFMITLAVMVYLLLHQFNCLHKPIWPSLTSEGVEKLDENTKKYMKGVLKARHIVERSMSLPPLFAPAHELSRQIQVINAYCREAELLGDPLQDTLWHLLDELIEVHAQIAPRSLFSESVKESIRTTAADLMRIMPMFVKRLAQREYDFLLISPLKRRILLKIFCMGMFLNGRSKKVQQNKMNKQALKKVWHEDRALTTQKYNYLDVLQPTNEAGPRVGYAEYTNNLVEIDEFSDDESLPFDGSEDTSVDVDGMMATVPSRTTSADPRHRSAGRMSTARATSDSPKPALGSPHESTTGQANRTEGITESRTASAASSRGSRHGSYDLTKPENHSGEKPPSANEPIDRPPSAGSLNSNRASYTLNQQV